MCVRSAGARPDVACLTFACVAKLQPYTSKVLPKQPLVVTPKVVPKGTER